MGDHNAEARRRLLKQGKALPPSPGSTIPRFPIADGSDLDSAIKLARTPEERRSVYKRARQLNMLGRIPAHWRPDGTTRG
jgi:hypothetical protein